jgi:hypothetical protein
MAWFKATGSIRHNHKRYVKGDVVEFDAKEEKSDLFVACDAPGKAAKKVEAPAPVIVPDAPKAKPDTFFK